MADFLRAISTGELAAGGGTTVELNGKTIAIFNVDGTFHAIDNTCTHAGGPLSEGVVDEAIVTCPWHGANFDITSGNALGPPASSGVTPYEVKIEAGNVMVKI